MTRYRLYTEPVQYSNGDVIWYITDRKTGRQFAVGHPVSWQGGHGRRVTGIVVGMNDERDGIAVRANQSILTIGPDRLTVA